MGTTVSEGDEVSNEDVTKDKLEKDSSGDAPPVSRENLISTAVRFLENTKIRSTSVELKTSFLKKKGLTDEEIATAFKQVSTLEEKQSTTSTTMVEPGLPGLPVHPNPGYLAPFLPTAIPQGYPMSKKIRDILNVVLLIGGFSYGINYLWRKYIRAWWYGIEKPSPNEILLQTSQTLLSTVLTLKEGMEKLQASLDSINGNETRSKNEVSDLKKEVMSLKGLLLSSRSFPQNPSILSSPGSASIPSWQLEGSATPTTHKTKSTKSSLDEGEEGESREQGAANWDGSSGSNRSSGSEIEMIGHESGGEEQVPIETKNADDNLD